MTTQVSADFSKYCFLIADDKPFIRSMVQSMLVRCQVQKIKYASSGAAALNILREKRGEIDCVLCDWNMEPMDGLTFLRTVRSGEVPRISRSLRIIMLTAHATEDIVHKAMSLDANGYLVKPVSMEKLVKAIEKAFATTINLKSPEKYLSTGTVELPNTVTSPVTRGSPWVLRSQMRAQTQEEVRERIDTVQEEAEKQRQQQVNETRAIINKEQVPIRDAKPDQLLAEDVVTEDGTLLVAAGTVLRSGLLKRLQELAGEDVEKFVVTIGEFET